MNQQVLILSIKPEFIDRIFDGTKTIELRKSKPSISIGDMIILYSTVPVKAVVGVCKVNNIIESTPQNIWGQYSSELGVSNLQFWEYYKESKKSIGIVLEEICKFEFQISLDRIKNIYPNFQPPQTFKYISKQTALKSFKKLSKQTINQTPQAS